MQRVYFIFLSVKKLHTKSVLTKLIDWEIISSQSQFMHLNDPFIISQFPETETLMLWNCKD